MNSLKFGEVPPLPVGAHADADGIISDDEAALKIRRLHPGDAATKFASVRAVRLCALE